MQLCGDTAGCGVIDGPVFPQGFGDVVADELVVGEIGLVFGCWC